MVEKKKTVSEILRRYLVVAVGILLITFSVALMIKANIGVAPMAALPYTMSLIVTNFSVGLWIGLFNLVLLLVQMIIRKRRLKKRVVMFQFITAVALGLFTDLGMDALSDYYHRSYRAELLSCVGASALLALGFYFCRIADVGRLPMASFLRFIGKLRFKRYAHTRIIADIVMAVVALGISVIFLGDFGAVREGTVLVLLCTGIFYKVFNRLLRDFGYILLPENQVKEMAAFLDDAISESHFVLTISHEYGSGGRTIAKRIAHELDLPYYDSEVIQMATENNEFATKYLEDHENMVNSTALYNLYDWYTSTFDEDAELTAEQICRIEAQVIQEIAAKDSCVIVGRLANYVLQSHKNSLHIFITADEMERVKRIMRKENLDQDAAIERIEKYTEERQRHCEKFSDNQWGNGDNYDIVIKSSKYGVDRTAAILLQLIKEFRLIQF